MSLNSNTGSPVVVGIGLASCSSSTTPFLNNASSPLSTVVVSSPLTTSSQSVSIAPTTAAATGTTATTTSNAATNLTPSIHHNQTNNNNNPTLLSTISLQECTNVSHRYLHHWHHSNTHRHLYHHHYLQIGQRYRGSTFCHLHHYCHHQHHSNQLGNAVDNLVGNHISPQNPNLTFSSSTSSSPSSSSSSSTTTSSSSSPVYLCCSTRRIQQPLSPDPIVPIVTATTPQQTALTSSTGSVLSTHRCASTAATGGARSQSNANALLTNVVHAPISQQTNLFGRQTVRGGGGGVAGSSDSSVTLTLITSTPLVQTNSEHLTGASGIATLTTATPLIPIVSHHSSTTIPTTVTLPLQTASSTTTIAVPVSSIFSSTNVTPSNNLTPSTSSVSSSSSSSACSSGNHPPTVPLSSRDWFSYEYKIDNIQDLIKLHENQQSFIQSPIFSFTNHMVNASNPSSSSTTTTAATSPTASSATSMSTNSSAPPPTVVTLQSPQPPSSPPSSSSSSSLQTVFSSVSSNNNNNNNPTTPPHQHHHNSASNCTSPVNVVFNSLNTNTDLNSNSNDYSGSNGGGGSTSTSNTTIANNQIGSSTSSSNYAANVVNSNNNSSPMSTSSSTNANNQNSTNSKCPSNWRLIFYPNGAGADCKNFLSVFLKYLSDEPVKIQMMFSIVDNNNEDVYVKYTVNKFNKSNDWGFKQLIHKNAILYQKEKFIKPYGGGSLIIRIKMRLDEHKHEYIKKLNENLHYCKLLSENFSQYYYNTNSSLISPNASDLNGLMTDSTTSTPSPPSSLNFSSTSSPPTTTLSTQSPQSSQPSNSFSPSSSSTSLSHKLSNLSNTSNSLSNLNNNNSSKYSSTQNTCLNNSSQAINNSSYYDILLLVKSNSDPNEAENDCNDCVANTTNCSPVASELKLSNKRTYSSLVASDSKSNEAPQTSTTQSKRMKLTTNNGNANSSGVNCNNNNNIEQSNDMEVCGGEVKEAKCSKCTHSTEESKPAVDEYIEFRAHKCILAARSPVFKAMFNYKLKENLTNKVVIEDCRPDVVKAMLKYIYTAYLPDDIKTIAIDLYIASEKYFIESLKIKCREYLVENLNLDSVIQTYILAELYSDSMLRKQSLKYINENIDKVTQNTDWNEFMSIYPQFFSNAFIRMCKKDF